MACRCDCGKPVKIDSRQFRDLLRAIKGRKGEVSGSRSFASGGYVNQRLQEPDVDDAGEGYSPLLVETERLDAKYGN